MAAEFYKVCPTQKCLVFNRETFPVRSAQRWGHTRSILLYPLKEECKIPSGDPLGRLQETLNTEMRLLRDAELGSLRQYD
ncbi:unnamed protein product [Boreogadus saida]